MAQPMPMPRKHGTPQRTRHGAATSRDAKAQPGRALPPRVRRVTGHDGRRDEVERLVGVVFVGGLGIDGGLGLQLGLGE
jgi:hypothetical protein